MACLATEMAFPVGNLHGQGEFKYIISRNFDTHFEYWMTEGGLEQSNHIEDRIKRELEFQLRGCDYCDVNEKNWPHAELGWQ